MATILGAMKSLLNSLVRLGNGHLYFNGDGSQSGGSALASGSSGSSITNGSQQNRSSSGIVDSSVLVRRNNEEESGDESDEERSTEDTLKKHKELLDALGKLQFQQYKVNLQHHKKLQEHDTKLENLSKEVEKIQVELRNLKDEGDNSVSSSSSRQQLVGEGQVRVTSTKRVLRGRPSTSGKRVTRKMQKGRGNQAGKCVYCKRNYPNLEVHVRHYCDSAPDHVNGQRLQCRSCLKYYARKYLNKHVKNHCEVTKLRLFGN